MRREGKRRHDLGRKALVERTWDWKEDYHRNINGVLRSMGGSFDWTREAFTMNSTFSAAVTETFVTLHEDLIYRANRLVNWCMAFNTTLSSSEVDYLGLKGRTMLDVPVYKKKIEFGLITYFRYQVEGSKETIGTCILRQSVNFCMVIVY